MATPGFTAESSLRKPSGHYLRLRSGPDAAGEPVGLAQQFPVGASRAQQDGLEIYGNWCGPFHGGGDPIDAVDRQCCIHDHCYDDRGYLDCSCDRDLISGMHRAMANPYVSQTGRDRASLIAGFFRVSPCFCHRVCAFGVCVRVPPLPESPS